MICSFLGGFADGVLAEFAFEPHWIDGAPPSVIWARPDAENKFGLRTRLDAAEAAEKYFLVRVDKVKEYANMVYTYQHYKLDTDFMARTRTEEIEASND